MNVDRDVHFPVLASSALEVMAVEAPAGMRFDIREARFVFPHACFDPGRTGPGNPYGCEPLIEKLVDSDECRGVFQ